MEATKCSHMTVGGKSTSKTQWLKPALYNSTIPYAKSTKFLEVIIDDQMTFNQEVNCFKDKAASRINILKIVSNRSWNLKLKTLREIFLCLIRSLVAYDFFCTARSNKQLLFLSSLGRYFFRNSDNPLVSAIICEYRRRFETRPEKGEHHSHSC